MTLVKYNPVKRNVFPGFNPQQAKGDNDHNGGGEMTAQLGVHHHAGTRRMLKITA